MKELIESVKSQGLCPTELKRGDVYTQQIGSKFRPIVIVSIGNGVVYGIPLSTCENEQCLCESSDSRFSVIELDKKSYFTKSVVVSTEEFARGAFIYTYENDELLNKAVELLKTLFNEIL